MVYCIKCGAKTHDNAKACPAPRPFILCRREEIEKKCFGILHGGDFVSLAIGIIGWFGLVAGFVVCFRLSILMSNGFNLIGRGWAIQEDGGKSEGLGRDSAKESEMTQE